MVDGILLHLIFFKKKLIFIQYLLDSLFKVLIFLDLSMKLLIKFIVVWFQEINLGIWVDKNALSWRDLSSRRYLFEFWVKSVFVFDLALCMLISLMNGATRKKGFYHVWLHDIFVFISGHGSLRLI